MGFIREPEGVDFVIQSRPLTAKQERDLSDFIAKRKREINKKSKKTLEKRLPEAINGCM